MQEIGVSLVLTSQDSSHMAFVYKHCVTSPYSHWRLSYCTGTGLLYCLNTDITFVVKIHNGPN